MALGTNQIIMKFEDGLTDRSALFAVLNFTTGDIVDLAQWFSAVKSAVLQVTTQAKKGLPTISGTQVTLDIAGMSGDSGWLLVWGSAAAPPP